MTTSSSGNIWRSRRNCATLWWQLIQQKVQNSSSTNLPRSAAIVGAATVGPCSTLIQSRGSGKRGAFTGLRNNLIRPPEGCGVRNRTMTTLPPHNPTAAPWRRDRVTDTGFRHAGFLGLEASSQTRLGRIRRIEADAFREIRDNPADPPEPRSISTQSSQAPSNHHALNFAGAFVDFGNLGVAEVALDGQFLGVAHAAVNLHGFGRHPHGCL